MPADEPREQLPDGVLIGRPRLRTAIRVERGKLMVFAAVAVLSTLLFGFCCSGVWMMPLSVESLCGIAIQFSLIGLPWWWLAFRSTYYTFRHDLEDGLAHYGKPAQLIDAIDEELRDALEWYRGHSSDTAGLTTDFIALTAHWLVQIRPSRAVVLPLNELTWVYKRVIPRRIWVRSNSYRIELGSRLRDGSVCYIEAREEILDDLAEELLDRRPGLLTGWRGEYFDLAARGPDALAKAHDERAAEFGGLAPEAQEAWLDESFARYEGAVQNVQ
jgi:hypothetical protein